ncbi:MAG: plastocyanin/azurin family copper-binding protein [Proteobacteria bacterium]|nr:plastocyanin/azurin family copper-binding protein [Pseudomonadota bacterium]
MKKITALILIIITPALFAALHDVTVSNNVFTPSNLDIEVGDTVTWTNSVGVHNVRADDDSFRCANGCDGDGGNGNASSANWSFSLTFNTAEEIAYFCEVHGTAGGVGMSGTITVTDPDLIFASGFE